jgi:hypothetical protein
MSRHIHDPDKKPSGLKKIWLGITAPIAPGQGKPSININAEKQLGELAPQKKKKKKKKKKE